MSTDAAPRLHPDAEILAPLLGTWRGAGHGEYPTIEPFDYLEEVTIGHGGKPFVVYAQRTRSADGGQSLHVETGYIRPSGVGRVELVIAHPFGATEIDEGTVAATATGVTLDVRSTAVGLTSTAKQVTAVERTLSVDGDVLHYTVRMAAVGHPLLHHLAATLHRQPS